MSQRKRPRLARGSMSTVDTVTSFVRCGCCGEVSRFSEGSVSGVTCNPIQAVERTPAGRGEGEKKPLAYKRSSLPLVSHAAMLEGALEGHPRKAVLRIALLRFLFDFATPADVAAFASTSYSNFVAGMYCFDVRHNFQRALPRVRDILSCPLNMVHRARLSGSTLGDLRFSLYEHSSVASALASRPDYVDPRITGNPPVVMEITRAALSLVERFVCHFRGWARDGGCTWGGTADEDAFRKAENLLEVMRMGSAARVDGVAVVRARVLERYARSVTEPCAPCASCSASSPHLESLLSARISFLTSDTIYLSDADGNQPFRHGTGAVPDRGAFPRLEPPDTQAVRCFFETHESLGVPPSGARVPADGSRLCLRVSHHHRFCVRPLSFAREVASLAYNVDVVPGLPARGGMFRALRMLNCGGDSDAVRGRAGEGEARLAREKMQAEVDLVVRRTGMSRLCEAIAAQVPGCEEAIAAVGRLPVEYSGRSGGHGPYRAEVLQRQARALLSGEALSISAGTERCLDYMVVCYRSQAARLYHEALTEFALRLAVARVLPDVVAEWTVADERAFVGLNHLYCGNTYDSIVARPEELRLPQGDPIAVWASGCILALRAEASALSSGGGGWLARAAPFFPLYGMVRRVPETETWESRCGELALTIATDPRVPQSWLEARKIVTVPQVGAHIDILAMAEGIRDISTRHGSYMREPPPPSCKGHTLASYEALVRSYAGL